MHLSFDDYGFSAIMVKHFLVMFSISCLNGIESGEMTKLSSLSQFKEKKITLRLLNNYTKVRIFQRRIRYFPVIKETFRD